MSLSREKQDYHLTPSGWLTGSFHGDFPGSTDLVEPPSDRVLTVQCIDETPSAFSKTNYYDNIIYESDDKVEIEKLKNKFGDKPDWFGYKK